MIPNSRKKKVSVLIPDGESHLLVYVMNCLGGIKDLDVFVMSSLKRNPMRFSRYIKRYVFYQQTDDDTQWIKYINAEITKNSIDIVMPIFEKGIRRMLKNKEHLSAESTLVSLPQLSTFDNAINKWKLARHCITNQISIPETILYRHGESIPENELKTMKFPVIVKPLEGFGGGMGIQVWNTKEELNVFLHESCDLSVIIQEYIQGYDIDCSVLVKNGEITAYTIQKGYLPGADLYKPQVGVEFIEEPGLFALVQDLMKSLSWNGVAHIDCRYDQKADLYKIIEVNPRIWVTVDGSHIMGVNFPFLWIQQSLGKSFDLPIFRKERYLNLKGVVKSIKRNILFLFRLKFLMRYTQFRFVVDDPFPTIYKFYDRTRNILMKKIK